MNSVIIQGSSRSQGNTNQIAKIVQKHLNSEIIDLKEKSINSYSYTYENRKDDFLPTMKKIVKYELIVFLSPVYWYSMSGIMKNFFDRITDCLKIEKETGRKLKGKKMIAISCGSEKLETEGFFIPFQKSAEYLGMNYLGNLHTWIENKEPEKELIKTVELFLQEIKSKAIEHDDINTKIT